MRASRAAKVFKIKIFSFGCAHFVYLMRGSGGAAHARAPGARTLVALRRVNNREKRTKTRSCHADGKFGHACAGAGRRIKENAPVHVRL